MQLRENPLQKRCIFHISKKKKTFFVKLIINIVKWRICPAIYGPTSWTGTDEGALPAPAELSKLQCYASAKTYSNFKSVKQYELLIGISESGNVCYFRCSFPNISVYQAFYSKEHKLVLKSAENEVDVEQGGIVALKANLISV